MVQAASYDTKPLALGDRGQECPAISEDDIITARLLPIGPAGGNAAPSPDHLNAPPPRTTRAVGHVGEIDIADLSAGDQILIETTHSLYVFTVDDPEMPCGRLLGGILGDRLVYAYLLVSWAEGSDSKLAHKSIRAGEKLIFVIESGEGIQRVTTSMVKSLLHGKQAQAAAPMSSELKATLEQFSS
jgi:hypothetical protein